jgi:hypothetical protein
MNVEFPNWWYKCRQEDAKDKTSLIDSFERISRTISVGTLSQRSTCAADLDGLGPLEIRRDGDNLIHL